MNHKDALIGLVSLGLLSGCAGSANHEVVAANGASDSSMSCTQIDAEWSEFKPSLMALPKIRTT